MKKLCYLILVLLLILSFSSCKDSREKEMSSSPDIKEEIQNQKKEEVPEDIPEVNVPDEKKEEASEDVISTEEIQAAQGFYADIPDEFVYERENEKTVLKIKKDGSFSGYFSQEAKEEKGDNFPEGTVNESHFTGKLSQCFPLDESTYLTVVESSNIKNPKTGEVIKNKKKYVYIEENVLSNMKEIVFFLPGTPTSKISDEFLKSVPGNEKFGDKIPENVYLIVDMNNQIVFKGVK